MPTFRLKVSRQMHCRFDTYEILYFTLHASWNCSFCTVGFVCCWFLTTGIFFIKLWEAFCFQMSGSLTPLLRYLCVSCYGNLTNILCSELHAQFCNETCRYKRKAYLVKLKDNLSCGFKIMDNFFKVTFFKKWAYLRVLLGLKNNFP